ncbi:hypothetical protein [Streptomyces sp. NPDC005012]|uniref:hypothetical protein n=1 Tax=Streptomyces sp. NPDC005012 TaxID=3154558 RepID=UPI0033A6256E
MVRPRQLSLLAGALLLVGLAVLHPRKPDDIVDATQFSIAFFATLLTGEAVIFAITFSAASSWPSLKAIDNHIAFREWVLVGWFAALFTACGLLGGIEEAATYGALLFILANVFGVFSFVRLFGLANIGGRNRLLRDTLTASLTPAGRQQELGASGRQLQDDPTVAAYLSTVNLTAGTNDPSGLRNLVHQLTDARIPPAATRNAVALHLDVLHKLSRAGLVSGVDPVVTTTCAEEIVGSLVTHIRRLDEPAPALGALSRYLAWLAGAAHLMSVRGIASTRAAREIVAFSTDSRLRILRLVDPDPRSATGPEELGSILTGPVPHLAWLADFTEFHGAHQASAFYGVHEYLTGTKFMGNYWDGDSVLTRLRDALYSPTGRLRTHEAETTRQVFGPVEEYDRFWTLVSVGALATLRDTRHPHPPELIRPEFTPDTQLLGAYVRSFASHRWFSTADEAREALLLLISHTEPPGSVLSRIRKLQRRADYPVPVPRIPPHRRPAALVLAVACRLAPLAPGEPDAELRAFLTGLPPAALTATAKLAARVLPSGSATTNPVDTVVGGLSVLQLVGAHTREEQQQ